MTNRAAWYLMIYLLLLVPCFAGAAEITTIPEVGPHFRLFTFEKNENPQNIMVVYTKLDPSCHFARKGGTPELDYYWLMDGKRYKPVHPMIKSNVRKRILFEPAAPAIGKTAVDEFDIKLADAKELSSAGDIRVKVKAEKVQGHCEARAETSLAGDPKKHLQLDSIYSESRKTFVPPFRKLLSLTITELDTDTGAKEKRVIR